MISLNSMASETQKNLIDFSQIKNNDWKAVNDGVMGGLSSGSCSLKNNLIIFSGTLSLKNNGGFASIRHELKTNPMLEHKHIKLRVKGDGRSYQFRIHNNKKFDGVSFKYEFSTKLNEWVEITLPIDKMLPTFRGRSMPDYGPAKATDIKQISFLLADKKPGSFQLEISSISYY